MAWEICLESGIQEEISGTRLRGEKWGIKGGENSEWIESNKSKKSLWGLKLLFSNDGPSDCLKLSSISLLPFPSLSLTVLFQVRQVVLNRCRERAPVRTHFSIKPTDDLLLNWTATCQFSSPPLLLIYFILLTSFPLPKWCSSSSPPHPSSASLTFQ